MNAPLHFTFITKYVAQFVAQNLLFPIVVKLYFEIMRDQDPFPRYGNIVFLYLHFDSFLKVKQTNMLSSLYNLMLSLIFKLALPTINLIFYSILYINI